MVSATFCSADTSPVRDTAADPQAGADRALRPASAAGSRTPAWKEGAGKARPTMREQTIA